MTEPGEARTRPIIRPESPPPPGTVSLAYESDFGPREIYVLQDPIAQRKVLTDALQILESTREKEGNSTYFNAVRQFNLMISAMQPQGERVDPKFGYKYAEQAAKLVEEYQTRVAFHQLFLGYEGAADINGIKGSVEQFRDRWMNKLFTTKEYRAFRYALQYYKDNGQNFVGMNELDPKVKKAIDRAGAGDPIRGLMTQGEFRESATTDVKRVYREKGLEEPSLGELEAMRNLAERFWIFSGTRVAQGLTFYDPDKQVELPDGTKQTVGGYDWVDKGISGGNFVIRDVERFKDRVITRDYQLRPNMDVFDALDGIPEVDLDSIDFITFMGRQIKQTDHPEAYRGSNLDFTKDEFWESYNFYNLANGEQPMAYWGVRYLFMPDGVKKDFLAYIQNPVSDENFLKAAKGFDYLSDDKFNTFVHLVQHRNEFLKSDKAREIGLEKPTLAAFDNMIEHWGRELKLTPEEMQYIAQKFLGSGAWVDVTLFWSHIKGNKMLVILFIELILGIIKEGLKPGK